MIVAAICWLLLSEGEDSTQTKGSASTSEPAKSPSLSFGPALAEASDLRTLATSLGHPVYWLGERPGTRLELTQEGSGDVYVRYLTGEAKVGDPEQVYVTVGTYPVPNAVAAVRRAAADEGVKVKRVANRGVAFASAASPGSAYVAYPGSDYQVEVFAPKPGEAFELISSGKVAPVE